MTKTAPDRLPTHVAIIMDGNGRWAKQQKLRRAEGHKVGIDSVREITETTCDLGIPYLTPTLFPRKLQPARKEEVKMLMFLRPLPRTGNSP